VRRRSRRHTKLRRFRVWTPVVGTWTPARWLRGRHWWRWRWRRWCRRARSSTEDLRTGVLVSLGTIGPLEH
jgi:hypothetical protein